MTTTYALQVFDILQDKYGAPYFPDDWKLKIFNMSQLERFKSLLPDDTGKGTENFESDQVNYSNILPFVFRLLLTTDSGGSVTYAAINSALQGQTGHADDTFFRIDAIYTDGSSGTKPVRWINPNQVSVFNRNVFKASTSSDLRYVVDHSSIGIGPGATYNIVITLIKFPRQMSLSPNVDPEWDDYNMNEIIAGALKLAGIANRDEELIQDVRLASLSVK